MIARNKEYGSPIAKDAGKLPATPRNSVRVACCETSVMGGPLPERRRYFQWFLDALPSIPVVIASRDFSPIFGKLALENCSPAELLAAVADLTGQEVEPPPKRWKWCLRAGPGREWTVAGATCRRSKGRSGGSRLSAGVATFFMLLQCGACHRFDGSGGFIGPDLNERLCAS